MSGDDKRNDKDPDKGKLKLDPAQAARALPVVTVLLLVLGLWFVIAGGRQLQADMRLASLQHARDDAVAATGRDLQTIRKKFNATMGLPAVADALMAGDNAAAARAIANAWPDAQRSHVLPADLQARYASLPQGGYGSLAVIEAALANDEPATRVISTPAGNRLAVAGPAKGPQVQVVGYVELPLERLTRGVAVANLASGTYLSLRQGSRDVLERGDLALKDSAEALAGKVGTDDLRIAAAVPNPIAAPLGLAAIAALVAGGILLLAALGVWFGVRPRLLGSHAEVDGQAAQTLTELQRKQPEPAQPKSQGGITDGASKASVAIDRGIFRAYDIRGIMGKTLDASVAELIGQAIGSLMHDQGLEDIVVGRDGRLSGPELSEGLIAGLRKAGRNVIDIGLVPTPVVYFGCFHLRTGCGVAITGSHNPPDYNGFKIVVGSTTLSGKAITDLHVRIAEDQLHEAATPGTLVERDISDVYVERIAGDIQIGQRLKVVVDAGNGAAGVIGPRVLEAIGAEVTPLFCDIDGTFPNHHPDPSEPQNLAALVQMVERLDADLGIAFDGDGDRLGVITRAGKNIFPDRLLMLFAADVLERNPGAVIVYDVKCTGRLPSHILRHGGSPLMWKTGHSLIKAKMRETEAELAGEMSGHFFFAERWYGFDDGIYAAARLLEILATSADTPDEVFNALPDGISTPEIKIEVSDGDPHAFVERFVATAHFEGARLSTIDGLRVDWPDGWGLVRASNTTPVLVMRFDADSTEVMARIQQAFREQLQATQPGMTLPF
ncbi:MAG: phosphomannomutase/phosphoglucomutase [Thermomonas sp.]